jgi:hypothetical protein
MMMRGTKINAQHAVNEAGPLNNALLARLLTLVLPMLWRGGWCSKARFSLGYQARRFRLFLMFLTLNEMVKKAQSHQPAIVLVPPETSAEIVSPSIDPCQGVGRWKSRSTRTRGSRLSQPRRRTSRLHRNRPIQKVCENRAAGRHPAEMTAASPAAITF